MMDVFMSVATGESSSVTEPVGAKHAALTSFVNKVPLARAGQHINLAGPDGTVLPHRKNENRFFFHSGTHQSVLVCIRGNGSE
jgi:hypothetical protein